MKSLGVQAKPKQTTIFVILRSVCDEESQNGKNKILHFVQNDIGIIISSVIARRNRSNLPIQSYKTSAYYSRERGQLAGVKPVNI